jgi:hypothetical protein
LTDWLIAGIVGVAVWSGLWMVRRLIAARYKKYSHRPSLHADPALAYLVGNTKQFLFLPLRSMPARKPHLAAAAAAHRDEHRADAGSCCRSACGPGRTVRFYLEMKELERGADRCSPARWTSSISSRAC